VRGCLHTRIGRNCFKHAIYVVHDFVVPKAENPIIAFKQPSVARLVRSALGVLSSINFNDQPLVAADKIDNEPANRFLTNKLVAVDRARA